MKIIKTLFNIHFKNYPFVVSKEVGHKDVDEYLEGKNYNPQMHNIVHDALYDGRLRDDWHSYYETIEINKKNGEPGVYHFNDASHFNDNLHDFEIYLNHLAVDGWDQE